MTWTIAKGDRINLGGEFYRVKDISKYREGVFLELKEIAPKKPVKVKK